MKINNKFDITDVVFLKNDKEQLQRFVTQINVRFENCLLYELTSGAVASWHYEFEITSDYDLVKATSN